MSEGLCQPNTTQIPNEVFDYWMGVLSPAEFKVLLCICRKTYGWHKDRDSISMKQIVAMTGLGRAGVFNNVKSLMDHGLLIKHKSKTTDGDDAPNMYEINVRVHSVGGGGPVSVPRGVQPVDQGGVQPVDPQKKPLTKERHTKEEEEGGKPPAPSDFSSKEIERAEHVSTTDKEHDRLIEEFGERMIKKAYERLSIWKRQMPKSKWKKHDNLSIRNWVMDAVRDDEKKSPDPRSRQEEAQEFMSNWIYPASIHWDFSSTDYVELSKDGSIHKWTINYSEKGFINQLGSLLRKLGCRQKEGVTA